MNSPEETNGGPVIRDLRRIDPTTGQVLPEGETGALVVTPLFTNNITPFLRWMSGDLVTLRRDVPG